MWRKILFTLLALVFSTALSLQNAGAQADYSKDKVRNPQDDEKVKEGYEDHQREYKERQQERERKEKGQIEKPFEVDRGGVDDANRSVKPRQ